MSRGLGDVYKRQEHMRVQGIKTGKEITSYQKFAPKYFYLFGTTYYLNVYFRF